MIEWTTIHLGMFDYEVTVLIGPITALPGFLKAKKPDYGLPEDTHYVGYAWDDMIWLPGPPRTPREYGTLAHECGHVMEAVRGYYGFPKTRDSEELLCHGIGFLVRKILETWGGAKCTPSKRKGRK